MIRLKSFDGRRVAYLIGAFIAACCTLLLSDEAALSIALLDTTITRTFSVLSGFLLIVCSLLGMNVALSKRNWRAAYLDGDASKKWFFRLTSLLMLYLVSSGLQIAAMTIARDYTQAAMIVSRLHVAASIAAIVLTLALPTSLYNGICRTIDRGVEAQKNADCMKPLHEITKSPTHHASDMTVSGLPRRS